MLLLCLGSRVHYLALKISEFADSVWDIVDLYADSRAKSALVNQEVTLSSGETLYSVAQYSADV